MNKRPIGIIDINVDGLYILNSLTKEFKNEDFIYINDIKNYPYEGREQEEIVKFVTENVEKLLEQNIKMLVVISDTIIEYCLDYLQTLNIPVINIVQSIINYVNKNYEQKNLALLAKSYILKANLYQKNFNYNHMYNIASEELENMIIENKMKTSKSFKASFETFKNSPKKEYNLLIITAPWLELLKIEILEYLEVDEFIKLGNVLSEDIKKANSECYNRGKGKITILSKIDKKEFADLTKWFNLKYKYIQMV